MADRTGIEWTDATWNIITGCSVLSPGCAHCYAMRLAGTRLRHHVSRVGLTMPSKAGPVWTGDVRFNRDWLDQPLKWKKPRRIFVCAHGDLFHENVPDAWIDQVFAVMALAPRHTFQVLTKRADRMRAYLNRLTQMCDGEDGILGIVQPVADQADIDYRVMPNIWPLPNIWLGVSIEDQTRAEERVPDLLATPAAKRFISAEPLLGPVDLTDIDYYPFVRHLVGDETIGRHPFDPRIRCDALHGIIHGPNEPSVRIDQVIVGGESGPGARPMHPDWARSLRDQCVHAGVAFFMKQWGEWGPALSIGPHGRLPLDTKTWTVRFGKKRAGRLLDGQEWNQFPKIVRPSE